MMPENYYREILKKYMLGIKLRDLLPGGISAETVKVTPDRFKLNNAELDDLDELFTEISEDWNKFVAIHNERCAAEQPGSHETENH